VISCAKLRHPPYGEISWPQHCPLLITLESDLRFCERAPPSPDWPNVVSRLRRPLALSLASQIVDSRSLSVGGKMLY
jgi:hypothetical protein